MSWAAPEASGVAGPLGPGNNAPMRLLRALEELRAEYGGDRPARKLALLHALGSARLPSAKAVLRLHEALCFLRAYPDDEAVLSRVRRMLAAFDRRRDLRRFARELADTGLAGTEIRYPFFAETAFWLARRFPALLELDREVLDEETEGLLLDRLDRLVLWAETPGLDEVELSLRAWLQRMKGPREGLGAFVARRFAALPASPFLRESTYEELGLPLVLRPGPGTPSRTRARARIPGLPTVFRREPLQRERPDLRLFLLGSPGKAGEGGRRPRVRVLTRAQGAHLIGLAREAMVTRSRDLDVFAYGDPRHVRLLECEGGLSFAAIGFRPERRLLLEAVYGFLTLQNDVPVGYVLNSALFGSAEVAYNVFETYRGAEAGRVYGWVLACVRHLFGVDSFTIYPYQLGQQNDEAIESGAWWFYQKLGFRPRDGRALALMRRELARRKRRPAHRSSRATLERLADHNLYFSLGRPRRDVIGEVSLASVGLAVTEFLGQRFGSERERGERTCAREAARRFGLSSLRGWNASERLAWRRWSPVLCLLRGVERWTAAEKRAATAAVRAKGGAHEADFVQRFDAHPRLRAEILRLTRRES